MSDIIDHLHRLDERTLHIANATDEQWEAARRYVVPHAPDCLAALGMDGAA